MGVSDEEMKDIEDSILPEEFKDYWRKKESTPSSPSNRHMSIYKCITQHQPGTAPRSTAINI